MQGGRIREERARCRGWAESAFPIVATGNRAGVQETRERVRGVRHARNRRLRLYLRHDRPQGRERRRQGCRPGLHDDGDPPADADRRTPGGGGVQVTRSFAVPAERDRRLPQHRDRVREREQS